MPKIAFIGAGSAVFTRNLVGDVLASAELRRRHDVRADGHRRGAAAHRGDRHRAADRGARARARRSRRRTDRRAALDGADYVVTSFQVGGYKPATVVDFEIPKRYGLRQTIADTLGVGGIMRGLRTIPVLLDVCRDMEELCPDALLLKYVNPMAMLCWAVAEASPIRTVGLCHSVQGTADGAGARPRRSGGGDRLPRRRHQPHGVLSCASSTTARTSTRALRAASRPRRTGNRVRYEVLKHFGYFVTESSEHFAEYVPWFIKDGRRRPDRALQRPAGRVPAPLRAPDRRVGGAARRARGRRPSSRPSAAHEYGARHHPRLRDRGAVRVQRQRPEPDGRLLIDNLPADCCVEVPCIAVGERASSRSPSARCRASSPR